MRCRTWLWRDVGSDDQHLRCLCSLAFTTLTTGILFSHWGGGQCSGCITEQSLAHIFNGWNHCLVQGQGSWVWLFFLFSLLQDRIIRARDCSSMEKCWDVSQPPTSIWSTWNQSVVVMLAPHFNFSSLALYVSLVLSLQCWVNVQF